jgi:hypothetical protein
MKNGSLTTLFKIEMVDVENVTGDNVAQLDFSNRIFFDIVGEKERGNRPGCPLPPAGGHPHSFGKRENELGCEGANVGVRKIVEKLGDCIYN